MKTQIRFLLISILFGSSVYTHGQIIDKEGSSNYLYKKVSGVESRAVSFENSKGLKGKAGMENRGAKGHAFERIKPGETKTLFDIQDMGVIRRFCMTIDPILMTPRILRALKLEMYWDGAVTPAVSVPLGDFFGVSHGKIARFENAFFASPEMKSFNSIIPMPFLKAAKIVLKNESNIQIDHIFYIIDYTREKLNRKNILYFHTHWRRESSTRLGEDFVILPKVSGTGRLLGTNIGVITDTIYGNSWWGEGEVNYYLDGDTNFATITGTGTEDYSGTSWGFGAFTNNYQGCLISDPVNRIWSFYRFHVPDPVYFHSDLKITIECIGGDVKEDVISKINRGVPLIPVSIDAKKEKDGTPGGDFVKLLERPQPVDLTAPSIPDGWVNFYRSDDWCATAYFYLDRPENGLPLLQDVSDRIKGLIFNNDSKRADE